MIDSSALLDGELGGCIRGKWTPATRRPTMAQTLAPDDITCAEL